MPAYVIVDIEVHDTQAYDEYRKLVGATLTRYGGKFIVRGGKIDVLEGGWSPKRLVVLEFESAARARHFAHSARAARITLNQPVALSANIVHTNQKPPP